MIEEAHQIIIRDAETGEMKLNRVIGGYAVLAIEEVSQSEDNMTKADIGITIHNVSKELLKKMGETLIQMADKQTSVKQPSWWNKFITWWNN